MVIDVFDAFFRQIFEGCWAGKGVSLQCVGHVTALYKRPNLLTENINIFSFIVSRVARLFGGFFQK
jgi:hypothetical protein